MKMLTVNKIIIKTVVLAALLTSVSSAHARLKYYRYNNHIPMVEMSLNMMVAMGLLKEVPPTIVNDGNRYNRYARARNAALSRQGYRAAPASYGVSYNSPFGTYPSVQNYPGSYGSAYSNPYDRFSMNPYGTLNAPWGSSFSNPWVDNSSIYSTPMNVSPWGGNPWGSTYTPDTWGANPWGGNPWGNVMRSPMQSPMQSPWGGTQYNPWSGSMTNPPGNPLANPMGSPMNSPVNTLGSWPTMQPSAYPMTNPVRNIRFPLATAPIGGALPRPVAGHPVAGYPVAMGRVPRAGGAAWVSPWRRPGTILPPQAYRPAVNPFRPNPYRPVMYPNSRYPLPPPAVFHGRPPQTVQPGWGGQYAPQMDQNWIAPSNPDPLNPYQTSPYTSEQDKLLISMNRANPSWTGTNYSGNCVTRSCGRKSYMDGLWVSSNGEKLGLRDDQFIYTDGKGQHLSGSIYITPNMMRAKVDATRRTITYRYKYFGNEMVTMSNDGAMRSFKRIPL